VFFPAPALQNVWQGRELFCRKITLQAQMSKDSDNHRRMFNSCPECVEEAAMIFKAPPQFGQCSMSISKTRWRRRAQAHARRLSLTLGVIGRGLGILLAGTRMILLRNFRVGRQYAVDGFA
jgi:hypothetical protein